jgi:hypothetical protein
MMRKTIGSIATLASVFAFGLFGAPQQSEAITISAVSVQAAITFNAASVGWTFPVNLSPGQDLVLAQDGSNTSSLLNFNFDVSDHSSGNSVVTVTVDGVPLSFTDTTGVFSLKGADTQAVNFNEAQNYVLAGTGNGYQIFFGYADNLHGPDACGSGASSVGLAGSGTCFPQVFNGAGGSTVANFFQGQPGPFAGTGVVSGHCTGTSCWDSAVIRIVATSQVPEPASLTLLGTGIVGLVAARRRRRAAKTQVKL